MINLHLPPPRPHLQEQLQHPRRPWMQPSSTFWMLVPPRRRPRLPLLPHHLQRAQQPFASLVAGQLRNVSLYAALGEKRMVSMKDWCCTYRDAPQMKIAHTLSRLFSIVLGILIFLFLVLLVVVFGGSSSLSAIRVFISKS